MPVFNLKQALGELAKFASKSKTEKVMEHIRIKHGLQTTPKPRPPISGYLTQLSAKLHASDGDLETLDDRGKRFALDLLWGGIPPWNPSLKDVDRWLAFATANPNPRIITRIGKALIRNGRPGPVTDAIRSWVKTNVPPSSWRSPYREIETNWGALSGNGPSNLANQMIAGDNSLFDSIDDVPQMRSLLTGSALVAEALRLFADLNVYWKDDVTQMWSRSLTVVGNSGIASTCPDHGTKTSVAMVVAVVKWKGTRPKAEATKAALDYVLAIFGDPRLEPGRWSQVASVHKAAVEGWLMERDFEALFEVIDKLAHEADIETWRFRRNYWLKYHKAGDVKRQWIIFGNQARSLADKLGVNYGKLKSGEQYHCGLLMELSDGIVVLEMNVNGATRLWRPKSSHPRFHQKEYTYSHMIESEDLKLIHSPKNTWQSKFDYAISDFRNREST